MFIDQLDNADALPALERMMQFAARRQTIIQHNIANISTPNFRPLGVDVGAFRDQLREAIDRRRDEWGGQRGDLRFESSRQVRADDQNDGAMRSLRLEPDEMGRNILFHDRNNRDVERMMQDLVENAGVFRVASGLLKSRLDLLRSAISERV
jgi:flagellar basal-body rod protein FlgB